MSLTPAELIVLGLLVEQPRHGYDLELVIEQRGIRQWADIGFSSIYYVLSKLEKRGLVASDPNRPSSRARRVFHATASGTHLATQQAQECISDARPVPHPMLVGLAHLTLLSDHDYAGALSARLEHVEARIASVRAAMLAQEPLPTAAGEVFSYSTMLLEAERSWLTERMRGTHD